MTLVFPLVISDLYHIYVQNFIYALLDCRLYSDVAIIADYILSLFPSLRWMRKIGEVKNETSKKWISRQICEIVAMQ